MFTTYFEGKRREVVRGSLPTAWSAVGVDVGALPSPRYILTIVT